MTRLASAYQVVNLLRNGGWDFVGSDGVPHFWTYTNLTQESETKDSNKNFYRVENNVFKILLHEVASSTITQRFDYIGTFDFALPLTAGVRSSLPTGYQTSRQQVLPAATYTVAFDFKGDARARVHYTVEGVTSSTDWQQGDMRLNFPFSTTGLLDDVRIEVSRNDELVDVEVSRIMLALGDFSQLPYTGEPLKVLPEGAIVMVCGSACPAGFEELGDTEAEPDPSWLTDDPGINARKGNYPRGGNAPYGDVQHTGGNVLPGFTDVQQFESLEGYLARFFTFSSDTPIPPPSELDSLTKMVISLQVAPVLDDVGIHTHEFSSGGTRPVGLKLRFCKRL